MTAATRERTTDQEFRPFAFASYRRTSRRQFVAIADQKVGSFVVFPCGVVSQYGYIRTSYPKSQQRLLAAKIYGEVRRIRFETNAPANEGTPSLISVADFAARTTVSLPHLEAKRRKAVNHSVIFGSVWNPFEKTPLRYGAGKIQPETVVAEFCESFSSCASGHLFLQVFALL